MRQAFKIFLMALFGMALLSSCVKEDLSNCLPQREVHTLKLTFVPRNVSITPTQADLKMAVVYIFDKAGNLFRTWTKQNPVLNTPYDTGIILGEDTYRLVGWINPDSPYTITPAYTPTPEQAPATRAAMDEARVTLNIPADRNITGDIPMLFYGSTDQVIAPTQDVNIEIPLTLDTYRIRVTIKGLPQDGSTYRLQISDTNGAYDFNNNFVETPGFNYLNSATAGSGGGTGDLVLSVNTLRLDKGRSPQISIVNTTTGRTVFPQNGQPSINLMDLIGQTGVDVGTTHQINIEVPAPPTPPTDGTNTTIVVNINGWNVVIEGYNINPYE